MGMKTIGDYWMDIDQNGKPNTGSTVIAYPTGTFLNGSTANPTGLEYDLRIDPTGNNNKICSHYDIYINAVMKHEYIVIGEWKWVVVLTVNTNPKVYLFTNLLDENGNSLPANIPNAIVGILSPKEGRSFFLSAQNDSGFTINAQMQGDSGALIGGGEDIEVRILVAVKDTDHP